MAYSQMCKRIGSISTQVKDTMLDPESVNMYTDSDNSDGEEEFKKPKKSRRKGKRGGKAVTIMSKNNQKPHGSESQSDVDENDYEEDDQVKNNDGTQTSLYGAQIKSKLNMQTQQTSLSTQKTLATVKSLGTSQFKET